MKKYFLVMFFAVIQLNAMQVDKGYDSDPFLRQMEQLEEEERAISARQKALEEFYLSEKEKIDLERQVTKAVFETRRRQEDDRYLRDKQKIDERREAIEKEADEAFNEVIIRTMHMHDYILKARHVPFHLRKKLVVEYILDNIVDYDCKDL
jgi:hypothetical protein